MIEDKEIGYILHKAAMTAKNNFTNKLSEFGITPGQYTVLKEIYNQKDNKYVLGLSPACIAERLGYDRPTISGIIDRLEAQDWITRLQNPEDKRSFIIKVTDKATDNLNMLNEICNENNTTILKGFTQEEMILFKKSLIHVINNYSSENY